MTANTPDQNYSIFTVCNLAYLPKALILAESVKKFTNTKLKIYIIDRKIEVTLNESLAEFIWIEHINVPNLYELAFKYDITEFSTSLKPWITLKLLNTFEKIIFLDPDTCLYHSVEPILKDLNEHSVVLTPHYTIPQSDLLPDSDIGMMRFGSFNLGFYAVRNSEQGLYFLRWWNDRCLRFCYFETQFGLSTDQKWISIAPCFFKDLYISFNLGYNVAFWNLHERALTQTIEGNFLINGQYPLIFFHFSSFNDSNPELLSKRPFSCKYEKRDDFLKLSLDYKNAQHQNQCEASSIKYGFDYMSDRTYISPTLRRAYAAIIDDLPSGHDPFDSKGVVGIFARKNHLISKKELPYVSSNTNNIAQHTWKFKIINLMLRLILRFIGPNNFMNFSRLLVYLSSYRLNKDLWKL